MRQILVVGGPFVGNLVGWALINKLPLHSVVTFTLAIMSGVLMLYAMARFRGTDKNPTTQR
jgi:hypothetical protein